MKYFNRKKKWRIQILAFLGIVALVCGCVLSPGITRVYADTGLHFLNRVSNLRTLSVRIAWGADHSENLPESVACALFSDQSEEPLTTFTLSGADASETEGGAVTWEKTLADEYPVYNGEGNVISYRIEASDADHHHYSVSVQENERSYQNLDFYVPSETIQNGESYLLADGDEGSVSLFEGTRDEGGAAVKVAACVISGDGCAIRGADGENYQRYIAVQKQGESDGEYSAALDGITWTAEQDASGAFSLINHATGNRLPYSSGDGGSVLFKRIVPAEMPVEFAQTVFSLKQEGDQAEHNQTEKNQDQTAEGPQEEADDSDSGAQIKSAVRAVSRTGSVDSSAGKRTITIKKTWTGENGDTSRRPDSLEFILYTDDPSNPLTTVTLSADHAKDSTTWEYTLPDAYPIYDASGNVIEYHMIENLSDSDMKYYRLNESSGSSTLQTGYSGVSVYVPVSEIEDGTDYLAADGSDGAVKLLRAEAYQTDGVLTTAEGAVNVLSDRTLTGEDGGSYSRYILMKDTYYKTLGGQPVYDTDFMTWRAHMQDGGAVLTSNAYRLWGLEDSKFEKRGRRLDTVERA